MKIKVFSLLMAASAIVFTSCGNNNGSASQGNAGTSENHAATTEKATANTGAAPSTTGANQASNAAVNEVVEHYLHVKNALANENGAEAANGAKALIASLKKVDPSQFTAAQKTVYQDVNEDLKEHAEHTAANAGKIDHQREHFVMMSNDVQALVKAFGASKTLYLDHCPMANDNKGANWISETEEIKNPYMGKKMPGCGKMEQVLTKK